MRILIILLFLTLMGFTQERNHFNCVDKFESIETKVEFQKTISYKIISSKNIYTEESFEFSKGIAIIEDLNEILNTKDILRVLGTIAIKNKLSEITAFKTCLASKIYFQQTKPSKQEIRHLKENFITKFKIDIGKPLSKKEKKKRDLIEAVATEICQTIEKNGSKNFNQKTLSNALIPKVSENVERMMKVYDLSFEISSELFIKDLTFYLINNCKTVNDDTHRKK
ncbi:hypothetical protein [Tenacibaculum ovolyticum]|uniref:hypothetical protein n=1 Tax=Tenacibaculum ovolyticum TaxID=104270 RepID=UPI001F160770|nr:hypothetical protein [Tenacibaculum ovolyticum]